VKDEHTNARSRSITLADRSHWNVVPFGMVYLLQLEFQGYCIWLCVRAVNRLWNHKLLLCTLYKHDGISAPQQTSLSKSVGVNRAIFLDLVCTNVVQFQSVTNDCSSSAKTNWQLKLHFSFSIFRWDVA
jgi:hypothetical protein